MASTSGSSSSDAVSTAMAAFTGRAVPSQMGTVRLGSSGRPVSLTGASEVATIPHVAVDRPQPRVVLQPQPRSPFARKVETTKESTATAKVNAFHTQEKLEVPPARVHATHYPTHRTPLATAKRSTETQSAATGTRTDRPMKRAPPPSTDMLGAMKKSKAETSSRTERSKSVEESDKIPLPKPEMSRTQRDAPPTSQSAAPPVIKLLTTRPTASPDRARFHEHVRVHPDRATSNQDVTMEMTDTEDEGTRSGWRHVNDSIDHIFEDPSIDVVRLQLLLHGKPPGGAKRKALEKERLHVAATEVLKLRQGNAERRHELQRRKDQILKLSEEIRSQNKPLVVKKPVAAEHDNQVNHHARHTNIESSVATRKPPVPRLSQLGVKRKAVKRNTSSKAKEKAEETTKAQGGDGGKTEEEEGDGEAEDETDEEPTRRVSDSILLSGLSASQSVSSTAAAAVKTAAKPVKKRKRLKTAKTAATSPAVVATEPPAEKQQRRALAREFMQLQKQSRVLRKAQEEEEKRREEHKRRQELQRLEHVRLQELEAARKRRIKLQQRERAAKQQKEEKGEEEGEEDTLVHHDVELGGGYEPSGSVDPEKQALVGLDASPALEEAPARGGEQVGSAPGVEDARLQKLLALGERTKQLTARLQSLTAQKQATVEKPLSQVEFVRLLHGAGGGGGGGNQSDGEEEEEEGRRTALGFYRERDGSEDEEEEEEEGEKEGGSSGDDGHSQTYYEEENEEDEADDVSDDDTGGEEEEEQIQFSQAQGRRSSYGSRTTIRARAPSPTRSSRLQHERFAGLETAYLRRFAGQEDPEFDLGSIGVQRVHVVWPRGDGGAVVEEEERGGEELEEEDGVGRRPRFEVLPSSSSSSSSSAPSSARSAEVGHGKSDSNSRGGMNLLDESVDAYAQRLMQQAERAALSPAAPLTTASWLRGGDGGEEDYDEAPPPAARANTPAVAAYTRQQATRGDEGLLRLLRETDDHLSVIDREAKRRFHEQQKRMQQQREEREKREQEELRERLRAAAEARHVQTEEREEEQRSGGRWRSGDALPFERLEGILQSVRETTTKDSAREEERAEETGNEDHLEEEERIRPSQFWNQQLASSVSESVPVHHVEIDRRHLQHQHLHHLQEEDREEEGEEEDQRRVLSPQSLGRRLLAAVEYHDAVQEAHAQLAILSQQRALAEAQGDALLLAEALKEEVEEQGIKQRLADDHAELEAAFDRDLQTVAQELEGVHARERRQVEEERRRLDDELRVARRRESSVQTEEKPQASVGTSARLRVEASAATEAERREEGVQYEREYVGEEESGGEEDEYGEDTFDASSPVPRTKSSVQAPIVVERGGEDEVSEVESAREEVEEDGEEEMGVEGDSIDSDVSMEEEEDETWHPRVRSAPLQLSASVNEYEDHEFEEEEGEEEERASPTRSVESISITSDHESSGSIKSSVAEEEEEDHAVEEEEDHEGRSDQCDSDDIDTSPARQTTKEQPSLPPTLPSYHAPLLPQPATVPVDIAASYVEQLEGRRRSEHALLAIRLQALEQQRQRQQEEAQQRTEGEGIPSGEAERRKKSVELAFLAEKMAIESQKAACEARYYQDLLAVQSLGTLPVEGRAAPLMVTPPPPQRVLVVPGTSDQVTNEDTGDMEEEEEEEEFEEGEDGYSEDEFASQSKSHQSVIEEEEGGVDEGGAHTLQSDAESDIEEEEEEEAKPLSEGEEEASVASDEIHDTSSRLTVQGKRIGGQTVAEASVVEEEQYEEDEFASVSDSVKQIVEEEEEVEGSFSSSPSPVKANASNDSGDIGEDEVYEDDGFDSGDASKSAEEAEEEDPTDPSPASPPQFQAAEDSMAVSQSSVEEGEESSTTKLLKIETTALQTQLKELEQRRGSPPPLASAKIESKKRKAQALLDAKDRLIKQQLETLRLEEERSHVDTIAQLALGVNVEEEVVKGRDAVKAQLQSEMETLQKAYPQLIPSSLILEAGKRDDERTVAVVTHRVEPRVGGAEGDGDEDGGYEEDEYEVDSFEKEASAASSSTVASVRELQTSPDASDVEEEEEQKAGKRGGDSAAPSAVEDEEITSDVEADGDQAEALSVAEEENEEEEEEEDAYSDDAFDADPSSSVADVSHPSTTSKAAKEEDDNESGGYSDDEFEASASRRSSTDSAVLSTKPPLSASLPPLTIATTTASPLPQSRQVDEQLLDAALSQVTVQLVSTASPTASPPPVRPPAQALGESIASSRHSEEEDPTTASMEEQTRRIEFLKHQIEQRKAEYVQVQKQIKVERRKEGLRSAEARLWGEMEELGEQLEADERMLSLTRQRGRLEAMELEAKQEDLRWRRGGEEEDLLGEYDFVETVEPLKTPVVMQDTEIQVRLNAEEGKRREEGSMEEEDADYLLACDHVEVAERPVLSVATATEVDTVEKGTTTSDGGGEGGDLLRSYEFVELVERIEEEISIGGDLLAGYDYVEDVEHGERYDDKLEPVTSTIEEEDEVVKEEAVDMVPALDQSPPLQAEEVMAVETITATSAVVEKIAPAEAVAVHVEEPLLSVDAPSDEAEEYEESMASSTSSSSADGRISPPEPVREELAEADEQADEMRVHEDHDAVRREHDALASAVSDRLLASLVHDAVTAITSHHSTTERRAASAMASQPDPHHQINSLAAIVKPRTEDSASEATSSVLHSDLAATSSLVDRLVDEWAAVAVRDGVQLHLQRQRKAAAAKSTSVTSSTDTTQSRTVVTAPPPPELVLAHAIADKIELTADGVRLPRLRDCVPHPDRVSASVSRAIYDAIAELAAEHHRKALAVPSSAALIDHVKRAFSDSVWAVRDSAAMELDRFTRQLQDDEQGDVDQGDLRLLVAQQLTGVGPLVRHFQHAQLHSAAATAATVTTPRQRRRSSAKGASAPALASWLLHEEEAALADRIASRILDELVGTL